MSQPRRRRRRRRGGASRPPEGQQKKQQGGSQPQRERAEGAPSSSRRRRRRGRSGQRKRTSPASSEDLVRAEKKPIPETLTGPHDGTTLEQVIGDLQSTWGVPQHPQEYRLVLKVPEERDGGRATAVAVEEAVDPPDEQTDADKPRREKAPAAPRIGGSGDGKSTAGPSRRRRGGRRRRRSKGGGGGSGPSK